MPDFQLSGIALNTCQVFLYFFKLRTPSHDLHSTDIQAILSRFHCGYGWEILLLLLLFSKLEQAK